MHVSQARETNAGGMFQADVRMSVHVKHHQQLLEERTSDSLY